jgi:hypothetical protein
MREGRDGLREAGAMNECGRVVQCNELHDDRGMTITVSGRNADQPHARHRAAASACARGCFGHCPDPPNCRLHPIGISPET